MSDPILALHRRVFDPELSDDDRLLPWMVMVWNGEQPTGVKYFTSRSRLDGWLAEHTRDGLVVGTTWRTEVLSGAELQAKPWCPLALKDLAIADEMP